MAAAVVLTFLAWRPSPYLRELAWIPGWLANWADLHGVLRNTVAFFVFGLLAFGLMGIRWPLVLGVSVFAVGLEVAQLWMPGRFFDPKDIVATLGGIAPAWLLVALPRWAWSRPDRDLPASAPPT